MFVFPRFERLPDLLTVDDGNAADALAFAPDQRQQRTVGAGC